MCKHSTPIQYGKVIIKKQCLVIKNFSLKSPYLYGYLLLLMRFLNGTLLF